MAEDIPRSLLDQIKPNYTIIEHSKDGGTNTYTGRDVTAFIERRDNRFHSHEVHDENGRLIYKRDRWGKVTVGASRKDEVAKKVGMSLGDAIRTGVRWGSGGGFGRRR